LADRLLLDTHAIIWWVLGSAELSKAARAAIANGENEIYFSPVSAMEITTKVRLGKLDIARSFAAGFQQQMEMKEGFLELPLRTSHAEMAGSIEMANQDPWDRLLIAQARIEGLRLVSNEKQFDAMAIARLW
jgi:PIN domain nuclease of toxin-antitoxin system